MSDIFNEYFKIAKSEGLLNEQEKTYKELNEKHNPRYDALDLEAIQMLYGVKPNGDEKHIVEQAHPNPVIVSPAYDRVNGLVENQLEQQNVMHYIATKPNHGKHIQERYVKANDELINEVLKIAFILDRDNHEDLMNLADSCAERLTKVALPLAPLLYLGAAAVAAFGLINNFGGMLDAGVYENSNRAVEELTDLVAGDDLPGQTNEIQKLISSIEEVRDLNEELREYGITTTDERNVKSELETGKKLLIEYVKKVRDLINQITSVTRIVEAAGSAQKSWLSEQLGDVGVAIERGWGAIWGDDVRDALVILDTLKESLNKSVANMRQYYSSVKAKAEKEIEKETNLEDVLPDETKENTEQFSSV